MSRTTRGILALGLAASLSGCGWVEKQKALVRRKALENETIAAAREGDLPRLRALLSKDPSLANAIERKRRRQAPDSECGTTLTAGVESGKPEVVELLLAAGADPDGSGRSNRKTPLHFAADLPPESDSGVRIAEMLFSRGARPDRLDDSGRAPVHVLLNHGGSPEARLPLLRLLLEQPGGAALRDREGQTPLHLVARFRQAVLLEALLLAGADPNAKVTTMERLDGAEPINGETPLHAAIRGSEGSGRTEGVFELCAAGADLAARSDAGQTPEALARALVASHGGSYPPGLVKAGESLAASVAPDGPCATWLARFRAGGRPASFAAVRLAQREYNCAAGDYLDCQTLAEAYEKGEGVERDLAKSLALFTRACEADGLWACAMVGSFHLSAKGVPADATEAARWFSRACEAGHGWSCNRLGEMARDGEGVPRDPRRALTLFEKACQAKEDAGCANGRALKAAAP